MQIDLGRKIRELRRYHHRTQENLAEALGVTAQAVSRWESGGSYPDMNLIPDPSQPETTAADLYMSWPWWHVEEAPSVKVQMQADPRWDVWVRKCNS